MSNLRKLQTEIDRVMKKVDEGVDLFDEIWEKVYSAEQQNQKEKYEMDLKKEIKKLQRLRDQIKTWIGSNDVKDKDALIDARKLIETKMEQFKICEKETKTKTYSKEGLARQEKLDPAEEAKMKTTKWIGEYIEKFNELVEEEEVEIEKLSAGKGKKSNKHLIEEHNDVVTNHKFHINKLEGIMRLVNNDRLDVEPVDLIKEDLDYYLEAYEEEDYMMSYDEEYFYESLGLEELDVVNVDRVTRVSSGGKNSSSVDDESMSSSKTGGKEKKSKKSAAAKIIPLTIGRARVSSTGEKEKLPTTPSKIGRATSVPLSSQPSNSNHSSVGLGPAPKAAPPVQTGASMASILKREGEQQEKERQQKALLQQQQQLVREQQARAQQEQLRQQQLIRQQQEQQQQQLRQQEALRQQQQQAAAQEALKRQQLQLQEQQQAQQRAQQEAVAKQQQKLQAQQQVAAEQKKLAQQRAAQQQQSGGGGGTLDILGSGLGALSLGPNVDQRMPDNATSPMPSLSAVSPQQQQQQPSLSLDANAYLAALNESFAHIPSGNDSDRPRTYTPRNPFPTPSAYPSTPSPLFENPAVFEKLGTDCLFFIFYYSQGTYQQYLAAKELKKQSWRYHKKYMTWFQRHEEPKVTTDEYEEGTYVYFDYETGWCQRIKSDFRFEYCFLEDSLA